MRCVPYCAQRLGFWGPGTPFADADRFITAMKNRGVGFLEMLAMEMKAGPGLVRHSPRHSTQSCFPTLVS
jgi:hypothetical protein